MHHVHYWGEPERALHKWYSVAVLCPIKANEVEKGKRDELVYIQ